MREIKFRGKRKDNGEWVCSGNLLRFKTKNTIISYLANAHEHCTATYDKNGNISSFTHDGEQAFYRVIIETVGQYTGLTDINGEKIFEGDIVKITDDEGETDFSDGGVGVVEFYDGLWYVNGEVNNALHNLSRVYYIEIIGNIHDNPELVKVGADK